MCRWNPIKAATITATKMPRLIQSHSTGCTPMYIRLRLGVDAAARTPSRSRQVILSRRRSTSHWKISILRSIAESAHDERHILAAEAEAVAQDVIDLLLTGNVGDVIEIAF